jgi:very-short-patch-repair endonuclease
MNDLSRSLRRNQTEAEKRLWYHLRNRALTGWKFRRQHPIGPHIADLVCIEARLVVEIDGGQHQERVDQDSRRTVSLEAHGYRVIRFWNNDVLSNTEAVLSAILAALGPSPQPSPPWAGEREVQTPSPRLRGEGGGEG